MPISSEIYNLIGKGVRSVADYDAERENLLAAKQQNLLGQAKLEAANQATADDQSYRRLAAGFGDDAIKNYNTLMQSGLYKQAAEYQKTALDANKTRAEIADKKAGTNKTNVEAQDKAFGYYQNMIGTATDPKTAASVLAGSYYDPNIGPYLQKQGTLEDAIARIPQDPDGFKQWQAKAALGLQKIAELTKVNNVNLGGTMATQSFNPATGQTTTVASAPITQSADNKANNDTSRQNNAATNAVALAGQANARAIAAQGGSVQVDGNGNMVVVPNRVIPGQPTQVSPVLDAGGSPIKSNSAAGGKISAEVQRQIGGVLSFDKDLAALEEALKTFDPRSPFDQTNTAKRAQIQSLSKQAQLSAKEAAALGALSGPDMSLLEGILNDPTNWRGAVSGSSGIAVQISEARKGNQRRVKSLEQQYGQKATEGLPPELKGQPAPPGAFSDPDKERRYQEWKRKSGQ